ncbi:UNVERIFIED_CONTAM: hypothetical protein FKN15_021501 [Acipenser sinensis]
MLQRSLLDMAPSELKRIFSDLTSLTRSSARANITLPVESPEKNPDFAQPGPGIVLTVRLTCTPCIPAFTSGPQKSGQVFVWGYGILGKGPNLSESRTPEMIPPTLLGCSEFNPDIAVAQIRCGLNHFAAITEHSPTASNQDAISPPFFSLSGISGPKLVRFILGRAGPNPAQLHGTMIKMENFQKLLELKKDLIGIDNLVIPGRVLKPLFIYRPPNGGTPLRMSGLLRDSDPSPVCRVSSETVTPLRMSGLLRDSDPSPVCRVSSETVTPLRMSGLLRDSDPSPVCRVSSETVTPLLFVGSPQRR